MGQLFKSFKRFNYTTSTYLNSSKNCSSDSTMIGMKIAIIFIAIAMISLAVNAAPDSLRTCIKKMDACTKECEKKIDTCINGNLFWDRISCFLAIFADCKNKCSPQGACEI